MRTSRCFRAIAGQICIGLMTAFGLISAMSPPLPVAVALVSLGVAAGLLNGSAHDACKEA